MDTNKMREQFEAAFIEEQVRACGEGFRSSAVYMVRQNMVTVRTAWWAWQASSQALLAEIDQLNAENEALRKEREGMALVPVTPSDGLLMSMAIRHDHGLGCPGYYDAAFLAQANGFTHQQRLKSVLSDMRKLHEEVVGAGFYLPEKDADYAAMAKEAPHE